MSTKVIGKCLFLTLLLPALVFAQQEIRYKDWAFKSSDTFNSAFTVNTNGQELGIVCKDRCLVYFSPVEDCTNRKINGYLISSRRQTLKLDISCVTHEKVKFLILEDLVNIRNMLMTNEIIYFFFEVDNFPSEVSIFSLDGALQAINNTYMFSK